MSQPAPKQSLVNVEDYERAARAKLPGPILGYYASGAGDEEGIVENVKAYRRLRIRPRVLVDVGRVDTSTTLLGCPVASPIGVAPWAMQRMADDEGELATARAARDQGMAFCLSSWSNRSLEEVRAALDAHTLKAAALPAAAGGGASSPPPLWLQLYVTTDRDVTRRLVARAEAAGATALVLTVDRPVLGKREADVRSGLVMPSHLTLGNVGDAAGAGGAVSGSGIDPCLDWGDVAWLRALTPLPIVVKGVYTAEDAARAATAGCAAVWVSNHGARQLESAGPPVEVLPEVVSALRGTGVPVYVDGGVRRGEDAFKLLALGASAVFVGRPTVWGLAARGERGVREVLGILQEELVTTMALAGCCNVRDITPAHVRPAGVAGGSVVAPHARL